MSIAKSLENSTTVLLKKLNENKNKPQIGPHSKIFVKKEIYVALVKENKDLKYELETKKKEASQAVSELQKIKESGEYIESSENTKNEVDSLKRQLDETKKELQNMSEEKEKSEQNDLQVKINAQDLKIEILEDSKAKLQKLKQLLATKVFLVNPKGENLESLINLEIEDLFSKYEQSAMVKDAFKVEFVK